MEIQHPTHKWQYVQSEYHPLEKHELWFVCECGAFKRVESWTERPETYYLPEVEKSIAPGIN